MTTDYDVILAAYNGGEFIREQLDSILNQTIPPQNIYVRDDLSNDCTTKILSEYQYCTIVKVLDSDTNLGYIKNFEILSRATKSKVVFFSDQDDYWFANKAETMLAAFDSNTNLVFSDAEVTDQYLKFKSYLFDLNGFNVNGLSINSLFINNFVTGATMAVRRRFLLENLPFPKSIPHDFYLATSALVDTSVRFVDEPLIKYRQHEKNVIGVQRTSIFEKIKSFSLLSTRWCNKATMLYHLSALFHDRIDNDVIYLLHLRYLYLNKSWIYRFISMGLNFPKYQRVFGFKFFIKDMILLRKTK
jgi:rhamnosyltransferase